MYALTMAGGTMLATPDVCITPVPTPAGPVPTPIPYPNIGTSEMANPLTTAFLVLTGFMPTFNIGTQVLMTSGDEPGSLGGAISHTIKGPANFIVGSVTTKIGGKPAVKLTSTTMQNMNNAPGMVVSPSQTSVMILS